MKKIIFTLVLTGALLGGCTTMDKVEKVSTTEVVQVTLDVDSIKGKEYVLENSDITINFENDKIYGFSGVNRYFGGMKVVGDKVELTNIASTMMAGPQNKMNEESEFLRKLNNVKTMKIEGNTVILMTETEILKFITK